MDGQLHVLACTNTGHGSGCLLGRVAPAAALDRASWRFWDGAAWGEDWRRATPVFDGASYVTLTFSPFVGRYLAWYMPPFDETILVRSALSLEGPWSAPQLVGRGAPSLDPNNWDYALVAHPELDREAGRIVTLSYFRPGAFLDGEIRLVEVTFASPRG